MAYVQYIGVPPQDGTVLPDPASVRAGLAIHGLWKRAIGDTVMFDTPEEVKKFMVDGIVIVKITFEEATAEEVGLANTEVQGNG